MQIPFRRELDDLFRSDRSLWWKIGGGALVGLLIGGSSLAKEEANPKISTTTALMLSGFLAVAGGLIALVLALKDVVRRRYENGQPVNPLLRFCLASRATIPFLGIVLAGLTIVGLIAVAEALHLK